VSQFQTKDMNDNKADLKRELARLSSELEEMQKALPAHSIRPHQLLAIEELENEIERVKSLLHKSSGHK
jgi:archaellum component FlaC